MCLGEGPVSVTRILDRVEAQSNRLSGGREALVRLTLTIISVIARELRVRRDIRRLAELDDTMLRDIGIARTEIERAARLGRSWSGCPER
jgi:uncharacterized protein YjiS (DUF1127 family)